MNHGKVALQQSLALFAANCALAGLVIWRPPVSAFVADALAITAFLAQWCGHRLGLKGVLWRYSPICGPWMGILLVLALLNALVLTPVVHSPNHRHVLATAQEPKAARGEKQVMNSIGMKLTLIPAGELMMGSGESAEETAAFFKKNHGIDSLAADFFNDEHPQHRVRITKPFYLGTYHVTRGQFRQFVNDTGYKTDAEKGDKPGAWGAGPEMKGLSFNKGGSWRKTGFEQTDEHPAVNVSWNDAVAFCKWLTRKEGKTYRLPTEAEWEYACRAGTKTRYSSGDDPETLAQVANGADAMAEATLPGWKGAIKASDGYVFTAPVGHFKPNAFGLYDMHGNAWQWCADWYGEDYYGKSPAADPKGPDTGNDRVLRGGSWSDWPGVTRSATRFRMPPDYRDFLAGFRVARSLQ